MAAGVGKLVAHLGGSLAARGWPGRWRPTMVTLGSPA
jgi:hypothetical protein